MMRMVLYPLATLLALASVSVTAAASFAQRPPIFPERAYTCRLAGTDLPLGSQRCLRTPQGSQVAECAIALNMSTWRMREGSCP